MTTQVLKIRELAEIPCSECNGMGRASIPDESWCRACNKTGYKYWQLWKLNCYIRSQRTPTEPWISCPNCNGKGCWVLKPEAELRVALEDYGLEQGWVLFIQHQQDGRFAVSFENLPICTEGEGYGATVLEALVQAMFSICNQKS